jgi:aromatic-L-amino-acid decarboxylase
MELLGLGSESLTKIPINDDFQMELDMLESKIIEDKANGMQPFCVIATAGTTNTGAFDDFLELRKICDREELWLHVDGAFGAWLQLSEKYRYLVEGMDSADSLALDLHKWMSQPFGVGCILVRDSLAHYNSFVLTPDYLFH